MAQNVLARVQIWTILLALALSAALVFTVSPQFALGVFLTALWAAAGLFALEKLLRVAVLPPGEPRNVFAMFLWGFAKLAVYGLAFWVLLSRPFPAISHAVGFTLMMVVLVVVGARAPAGLELPGAGGGPHRRGRAVRLVQVKKQAEN